MGGAYSGVGGAFGGGWGLSHTFGRSLDHRGDATEAAMVGRDKQKVWGGLNW